jgi:hypothetical protein
MNRLKFDYVTPEDLLAWSENKEHFFLIHTLKCESLPRIEVFLIFCW